MTKIPPRPILGYSKTCYPLNSFAVQVKKKKKKLHKAIICEIILRSGKNYFEKN